MKITITALSSHALLFPLLVLAFTLVGCGSKDLSRAEAQRLIEQSGDFKQPFALELMQGDTLLPYGKSLAVLKTGAEETPAQAASRKVREYYEQNPQIAVAAHLGLVEARVRTLDPAQPKSTGWNPNPRWGFEEEYLATDQAKALWKRYDLPPTARSVPLAGKEIIEVTGIAEPDAARRTAQFTWRYAPNEAGCHLDTATAEFQALPPELRQLLDGTLPSGAVVPKRENKTMTFANPRPGEAVFRRYDDGWRLEAVLFR